MTDGNLDDAYVRLLKLMLELAQPDPSASMVIPWHPAEAEVFALSASEPDEIDLLVRIHHCYETGVRLLCNLVGMTPRQLRDASLDDSFPSPRARKLWLAIGHHAWPDTPPDS